MRSVNLRRWEAALKLQCVILRSEAPEICWAQSSRAIWNRLDTISIVKCSQRLSRRRSGIAPAEAFETTIDLNVSAYIPDSYISNESLKLDTYKRIAAIENKEEYEDMTEELTDRFGEPPKNVQNLLAVAELKALAHCAYVTELKQMGDSVRVTLQQHAKIDVARIPELLQKYRDELKFQMESLAFVYTPRRRNSKEKIDLLEKSHALVEDLLQITQE